MMISLIQTKTIHMQSAYNWNVRWSLLICDYCMAVKSIHENWVHQTKWFTYTITITITRTKFYCDRKYVVCDLDTCHRSYTQYTKLSTSSRTLAHSFRSNAITIGVCIMKCCPMFSSSPAFVLVLSWTNLHTNHMLNFITV